MRFLPDLANGQRDLRVAVVGFGYVGSCLGVALAERGATVHGVDSDRSLIAALRGGDRVFDEPGMSAAWARLAAAGRLTVGTELGAVSGSDVVLVTVGTPIDADGGFVADALATACGGLGRVLTRGQLVIVKSTVPPGTTRQLVRPLLESGGLVAGRDFGLAYCPERLAEGAALAQLPTLPVVVGGLDPDSGEAAAAFWTGSLGVPTVAVDGPEIAELVKLADNWWIDANVALANELAQVCGVLGIDALDVIGAANTLPKGDSRVNILRPSIGVGGSCLPKDPPMLARIARDKGVQLHTVTTARAVNDAMPQYSFELIRDELAKLGKPVGGARIAVLGLAFKNETGDLRLTPVRPLVAALVEAGAVTALYDPLADPAAVRAMFGAPLESSLEHTVAGADCVAVLAGHRAFHQLDLDWLAASVAMPCLLFDGRAYYPRATVARLRALGFAYRGIGR